MPHGLDDPLRLLAAVSRRIMPEITEHSIGCPYCGETISILVDESVSEQNYVEDCQVCCRPIVLNVVVDPDGEVTVVGRGEDE